MDMLGGHYSVYHRCFAESFVLGLQDLFTKETAGYPKTISIFYKRLFNLISIHSS